VGWVTLRHDEISGTTRVPDHPDVIAAHQGRGWSVVVEPDEADRTVYIRDPDAEWVELVHPELPTATHRVPNNAPAITGAIEAGWQYPVEETAEPEESAAAEEPESEAPTRGKRAKTPAADAGTDEPAGDGTQQEE
jgi:hypothetical protein